MLGVGFISIPVSYPFQNGELFYIILVQNQFNQTSSLYKFGLFRLNGMNNLKRAQVSMNYSCEREQIG